MKDQPSNQSPQPNEEELTSEYANNVYFLGNIWDLKLLFGELTATSQKIDWHTSITLPWAQAKLMEYYLKLNIAAYEASNGRIKVPESMLPPAPPPIAEEDKNSPGAKKMVDFIIEERRKFLESMK